MAWTPIGSISKGFQAECLSYFQRNCLLAAARVYRFMLHRLATPDDCQVLAELNYQLIRDEGHRNAMPVTELAERMRAWLGGEYRASIFEDASGILAYALYREEKDQLHLRQFFVQRYKRRLGIGVQCMEILYSSIWPRDKRIVVEVLSQNPAAIAFWKKVGFVSYSLCLEIYPNLESSTETSAQSLQTND